MLTSPTLKPSVFHGLALVERRGVMCCEGADAADFLHNQLSQDIKGLAVGQSRMALFCNAKGRMQASMWVHRKSESQFYLLISQSLLPQTLKRLSMFVLRAKVKLSDVSAHFDLWASLGLDTPLQAEVLSSEVGASYGFSIQLLPALGQKRVLLALPKGQSLPSSFSDLPRLSPQLFELSEIFGGVATIDTASFEHFVPQMLNMESIGAVSFKKGCYPGQEVVARSQFRGTLKRRALLVVSPAELKAGQELFDLNDAREPCGQVVQVAEFESNFWAIACFSLQSLLPKELEFTLPTNTHTIAEPTEAAKEAHSELKLLWSEHLSSISAEHPPEHLALIPLPYALLEDI